MSDFIGDKAGAQITHSQSQDSGVSPALLDEVRRMGERISELENALISAKREIAAWREACPDHAFKPGLNIIVDVDEL